MKLSLEKKIFFGFIINILIAFAFGWTAYKIIQNQKDLGSLKENHDKVILSIANSSSLLNSDDNYANAYVITGDEKYLRQLYDGRYLAQIELESFNSLIGNDEDQKKRMDELENLIEKKIQNTDQFIELRKYKDFDAAKNFLKDEKRIQTLNNIVKTISQIQDAENIMFKKKMEKNNIPEQILKIVFPVLFFCLIILLFVVYFIIRHELKTRKEAELLVEGNYQLIRSIINNTNSPIFIKKINGQYLLVNKQFEKLFHYTNEQLVGKTDHDIFEKDIADTLRAGDVDIIKTEKEKVTEGKFPHNSEMHNYIVVKFPIFDSQNKIYAIGGLATDITERTKLDILLKESEAQGQTIFSSAPDAIVVINEEDKIIRWNSKAESLFGWTADEVLGKALHEVIMPKKYIEQHLKGLKHFLDTGEGAILNKTVELAAINKKNIEFDIELSIAPAKVKDKYIFIAFVRDITERKILQKKTVESEKFLSSIIDNIPSLVFIKDAKDLRYMLVNKAVETHFKYKKEEVIGKNAYDFFPKEQADSFTKNEREVLEKGELFDIPEEPASGERGQYWLHTTKIPIKDDTGKPIYLLGISENITEKKRLEEEKKEAEKVLLQNEQRIKLIIENIGEAVIVVDKEEKIILSNHMAEEIVGVKENDILYTPIEWTNKFELFYADGKTTFPVQDLPLEKALRGETTNDVEIIMQERTSMERKRVKIYGGPIKDENNNIVAAVTTVKDITQLNELADELKVSEMKYRNVIGFRK